MPRFQPDITPMPNHAKLLSQTFGKISAKTDAAFKKYQPKGAILAVLRVIQGVKPPGGD